MLATAPLGSPPLDRAPGVRMAGCCRHHGNVRAGGLFKGGGGKTGVPLHKSHQATAQMRIRRNSNPMPCRRTPPPKTRKFMTPTPPLQICGVPSSSRHVEGVCAFEWWPSCSSWGMVVLHRVSPLKFHPHLRSADFYPPAPDPTCTPRQLESRTELQYPARRIQPVSPRKTTVVVPAARSVSWASWTRAGVQFGAHATLAPKGLRNGRWIPYRWGGGGGEAIKKFVCVKLPSILWPL